MQSVEFVGGRNGGLLISKKIQPNDTIAFSIDNTWGCPPIGVTSFTPGVSDPAAIPVIPSQERLTSLKRDCDLYAMIPGDEVEAYIGRPVIQDDTFRMKLVHNEDKNKLTLHLFVNQKATPLVLEVQNALVPGYTKCGVRIAVGALNSPNEVKTLSTKAAFIRLCTTSGRSSPASSSVSPSSTAPSIPDEDAPPEYLGSTEEDSQAEMVPREPLCSPPLPPKGLPPVAPKGLPPVPPKGLPPVPPKGEGEDKRDHYVSMVCNICFVNVKNAALKCGHLLCEKCAEEVKVRTGLCPYCSRQYHNYTKLYLT